MRSILLLATLSLAACGATPAKDTDDTDDTDDSEIIAETDTETTVDTEETDEPTTCGLTAPPTATPRATGPTDGESITFARDVEACVSDSGLSGQWLVTVSAGNGDLLCLFVAPFSGDGAVTGDACTDCDEAFGGVVWSGVTHNPSTNCELFGIENRAPYYGVGKGTSGYTAIGAATGASPDLYHQHVIDGWVQIDDSVTDDNVTATRTAESFDDGTKVTVSFETTYTWVEF